MKKNILLIGGSTGIGFETAKLLHQNHNIIVASRNKGDLDSLNVTHHTFDVMKDNLDDLDLPDQLDGLVSSGKHQFKAF